ncbi:ABC exporter membrane fusion protein [Gloeocapsopsis dulcis]|nr:ABC exporter membrane fusion protein [Gloeocapsopsis dulcis]WNN90797.1 ABC exporter membrane fusion protein [Gloeocapsopsis dulcis]
MHGMVQNRNQFIKAVSQRGVVIAGVVLLGVGGAMTYRWMRMTLVRQETAAPVTTPVIQTVTALGRLEPLGTVIKLSAPTSSQGNRVERLLVQEGDRVQAGQVIAILDSHDQRKAALEEAEEQVNVARAQLDVIQAGAKQGEINAQQAEIARLSAERQGNIKAQVATVARLQSELQNAQAEFNRYQSLYQEGAISASERDSRRLALDTAQKSVQEAQVNLDRLRLTTPAELNRARATLEQIAEVRPVDVRSAQAEVNRAIAARNQAKASFDQSVVRSPINGEVLDIYTRAGEVVSTDGIAEIGQTRQMQAIAEVYQSDISKVQVGQQVRVTSDSIPSELTGMVERVGSQVRRQEIVNTDPSANIDARVIEVQINLDDASSQKAAKFTNLQVQVVIEQ